MKKHIKILSFITALSLSLFIFSACADNEANPSESLSDASENTPEIITDPSFSVSDNIKPIALKGDYKKIEDEDENFVCGYRGLKGAEYYAFYVYSFAKEGKTAYSFAKEYEDGFYALSPIKSAPLSLSSENCVLSVVYDDENFSEPLYIQNYFYEDGDTVYKISYQTAVFETVLGNNDVKIELPYPLYSDEVPKKDEQNGCIHYFATENDLYPCFKVFAEELKGRTMEDILSAAISDKDAENTYEFTLTVEGIDYSCGYAEYTQNGKAIKEYYTVINDTLAVFDYFAQNEDRAEIALSAAAAIIRTADAP